ncbi:MAG TPA: Sec-independent protein translocase protein TatB [Candidatus Helicobacter avicola]|nr:Sec-independent protein translocase protein TatB [Candidatus Helicobacter avicola]
MFGVGIFEIVVILVVAVIFLGPDKLPQAIVDITKFLRAVKKTINDAKDTFDKEVQISELKKEALEYKKLFEDNVNAAKGEVDSLTKDLEFKELSNLSLNNPTNQPIPTHPQKSAESRALESLNFQSEQIDADMGISHDSPSQPNTQDGAKSTFSKDCSATPSDVADSPAVSSHSQELANSTQSTQTHRQDSQDIGTQGDLHTQSTSATSPKGV